MEYGIVYLLTNPVMPGLVKIGMTTQEDIDKRMKELYTTGGPVPFECQFACKVKKGDCANSFFGACSGNIQSHVVVTGQSNGIITVSLVV